MNEQLSGWLDGESDDLVAERVLRNLKDDPAVFDDARMSLLIGDALRGEMALSASFSARFSEALHQEPTVLAPVSAIRPDQAHKRFVALSAAASIAVFSVLGWFAFNTSHLTAPVAGSGPMASATVVKPRAADNAKMQEYMAMHQELSSYQAVAFNTAGQ